MFSIGEFARHGRVSVRMLRHYDAIGLLRPACVDPVTGYRSYQVSQLAELNRVIALKELGFTLQQVQAIMAEQVSLAELRGMLRLRRAEIHARIEAETTRLARVEARLLTIEDEARVPSDGVVVKRLAPVRAAELTGVAAGFEPEAITPVIGPLYCDLWQRMAGAGLAAAGPALAYYEDAPAGDGAIVVHAAVPVHDADPGHGISVVDLAEVQSAATIIHHGSMDDVLATGQALARWIDANGYRSAGYVREVTLSHSADPGEWVTELQQPIYATGGINDMSAAPEIVTRDEQPYVAVRARVAMDGLPGLGARFGEVFGWLGARGVAPAGPSFFKYNVIDMMRELEVEAGVPVAAAVDGDGQVVSGVLPAGRYATLTHTGHPAELVGVTKTLLDWAAGQGLAWDMSPGEDGDHWGCRLEFHLTGPAEQPDMSKWVTQLAFRLAG